MGPLDLLNHLLNFAAPAFFVAGVCALVGRLMLRKSVHPPPVSLHWAVDFVAGLAALGVGLWHFGADGAMESYAAMVLCCATCQWLMTRLPRR